MRTIQQGDNFVAGKYIYQIAGPAFKQVRGKLMFRPGWWRVMRTPSEPPYGKSETINMSSEHLRALSQPDKPSLRDAAKKTLTVLEAAERHYGCSRVQKFMRPRALPPNGFANARSY